VKAEEAGVNRTRFDALLWRRTITRTRRRVLLGLLGVGLLGSEAEAKKHKKHKKKKPANSPPPDPTCVGQPDGFVCGDGQQCSGGVCATPLCPGNTQFCLLDAECCSGVCNCFDSKGSGQCDIRGFCRPSNAGEPCASATDCAANLDCTGFVCR